MGGRVQRLVTTDLSPTGAFFASSKNPEVGEVVEVNLRGAGVKPSPVRLRAEVIRIVLGGSASQPGFAVRWVTAHSEVGGEALFQFLCQVLRVPGLTREHIGNERTLTYEFPDVGGEFPLARSISSGGPPLITRERATQPLDSVGGRLGGSRIISEAIGGRRSAPSMAPRPPGSSSTESVPQGVPSGPFTSTANGLVSPPAPTPPEAPPAKAPEPAAKSAQSSGWVGQSSAATDRSVVGMSSTARRSSSVVQADNVMMGTPNRRRSESTNVQEHRKRFSERSKASDADVSYRADRFTGVPDSASVRTERLLPDIEPGGRRPTRPSTGARDQDSPFQERSLIFGGGDSISTIGSRSMSKVAPEGEAEQEQSSVAVDVPVTYELDSRFMVGRIVAAAPLAVEIETTERPPQLEQQLIVNMPVEVEREWGTVYLIGKLLRVPEERGNEKVFVLHIERLLEGKHEGAYGRFLAQTSGA